LLYSDILPLRLRPWIVFAGAQDLYRFSEDDTSPIGSRAERCLVDNLDFGACESIVKTVANRRRADATAIVVNWIYKSTGGHAGLSVRLAEEVFDNAASPEEAVTRCREREAHVLRIWALSFSEEARAVHDAMIERESLSALEVAQVLNEKGLDRLLAYSAIEELRFTGVAQRTGDGLTRANDLFWGHSQKLCCDSSVSTAECDIWRVIEKTELGLRDLVQSVYSGLVPESYEAMIRDVLGAQSCALADKLMMKSKRAYRLSPEREGRQLLECLYLDDLKRLIVASQAWGEIGHVFRDKRQLEDLFAAIAPVRNDRAHFAKVPKKELERCGIACDDLLVLIECAQVRCEPPPEPKE
jgi:hypothetical protein